jgi:hypothetical protein
VALSIFGHTADFLDRHYGNIAINVKYHGDLKLSEETQAALKKLDGAARDNVIRYAEESLQDNWWASMRERSKDLGLGELWSAGRSGGWLVFKLTLNELENRFDEAERSGCSHCSAPYEAHVGLKCPFQASSFQPVDRGAYDTFEKLQAFSVEVRESLQHVGDSFEDEVTFQLENLDAEYTVGLFPTGGTEDSPAAFDDVAAEE